MSLEEAQKQWLQKLITLATRCCATVEPNVKKGTVAKRDYQKVWRTNSKIHTFVIQLMTQLTLKIFFLHECPPYRGFVGYSPLRQNQRYISDIRVKIKARGFRVFCLTQPVFCLYNSWCDSDSWRILSRLRGKSGSLS